MSKKEKNNRKTSHNKRADKKDFSMVSNIINKSTQAESVRNPAGANPASQNNLNETPIPLKSTLALGEDVIGNMFRRERRRIKISDKKQADTETPGAKGKVSIVIRSKVKTAPQTEKPKMRPIVLKGKGVLTLAKDYAQAKSASAKALSRKNRALKKPKILSNPPLPVLPKLPKTPDILLKPKKDTTEENDANIKDRPKPYSHITDKPSEVKLQKIMLQRNQFMALAKAYAASRRSKPYPPIKSTPKNQKHASRVFKALGAKSSKVALRSARSFVEIGAKTTMSSAEGMMGSDSKAAIAPIKSTAAIGGALLRPRILHKKTFHTVKENIKSSLPAEVNEATAAIGKGARTISKTARTVRTGVKVAKKTAKVVRRGKRAFKTTLTLAKIAIKITKAIKAAKLAVLAAKVAIKIAKFAVKVVTIAIKSVVKMAAVLVALIGIKIAAIVAVVAVVSAVFAALGAVISFFIPGTDPEVITTYAQQVRNLDDATNAYIDGIIASGNFDKVVYMPPANERLHVNMIKFITIFNFWRDTNWDGAAGYITQLHQALYTLNFGEEVFYERVYFWIYCECFECECDPCGCETEAYEYQDRLKLVVMLHLRSITEIGTALGLSPSDIQWLYEIYENQEILENFPELEEFL